MVKLLVYFGRLTCKYDISNLELTLNDLIKTMTFVENDKKAYNHNVYVRFFKFGPQDNQRLEFVEPFGGLWDNNTTIRQYMKYYNIPENIEYVSMACTYSSIKSQL